jgi:adenosylhomocysteine nucleosidase
MTDMENAQFLGISFTTGTLEGRKIVLAETGVGKVNAAVATALLLEHFNPREVIFTGIAGGVNPDLLPGDIVIGAATAHHDYATVMADGIENMATRNPASGKLNPVYFASPDELLRLAGKARGLVDLEPIVTTAGERKPRFVEGIIATGDSFIASSSKKGELRARLQADAVEMEGAAVAQVCYQIRTPCIVIRSLSDNADDMATLDLERFYRIAANNSARLVIALVGLLAADSQQSGPRATLPPVSQ